MKVSSIGMLILAAAIGVGGCTANPGGSGQIGDSCSDLGWGKIVGTAGGAAAGGYLGSRWKGAGSGTQTAATVAGTLLGAAGGFFAGRSIDRGQCESATMARQQALNSNQPINWNQGNASGTFTPTGRTGSLSNGQICKEYEQTIRIDGQLETGVGQACQRPDGKWEIHNG
ncbi:hypothetical protein ACFSM5_04585 [Lacibacterium aquatile]|uniref:17 kDa surface antigen n=1 Tax=Lacibacterium aquatile TaxID=1168082 RepID=A0ABW5DLY4_9PROT